MKLPPLLFDRPRSLQVLLAVVVPVVYGAITGIFLGISEPVYVVLSLLGVLGGVGAGIEHLGAREGALRGVFAGAMFGGSILIAHEIHGAEAKADLPDPAILLVVLTAVLGAGFGALGGRLRLRAHPAQT